MESQKDAGKVISILSNQIKRYIDHKSSENGLTGVQGRILHYIIQSSQNQGVYQKDIETAFHLRRSTATGILQLMEKNGFILRQSVDYDARLKKIIVTPQAMVVDERIFQSILEMNWMLTQNIPLQDMQTFYRVAEQMLHNLEQEEH